MTLRGICIDQGKNDVYAKRTALNDTLPNREGMAQTTAKQNSRPLGGTSHRIEAPANNFIVSFCS
jgi:hypothetical protein